jgi:CheY-like chemotaxis protein
MGKADRERGRLVKRILLVGDDEVIAEAVTQALHTSGYAVDRVAHALAHIHANQPLAVSDSPWSTHAR